MKKKRQTRGARLKGRLKDKLRTVEVAMILEGLAYHKWNKTNTAKELGISRAGLIMKVQQYRLEKMFRNTKRKFK